MSTEHTLPQLAVRNAGKATKRRKQKIPSLSHRGKQAFPDLVVGGALWLRAAGWRGIDIAELLGVKPRSLCCWQSGSERPHVVPSQPGEGFWNWLVERATR